MRLVGAEPSPLRRWIAWFVALGMLAVVVGLTFYARQQDAARRLAEGRADAAETQLAVAQASLTAIARTSAAATATAAAESNQPEAALRRALALVFEAYKDPTDGKLRALSDAFSPDALSFERTEAEHLLSGGLHLAGSAAPEVTVLSTTPGSADETEITTHEIWTYDEVDAQSRKTRCIREESDQTYTLHRVGANFLIQMVALSGGTRRSDC
ncbi:MAG TPA: hypothetical protein VKV73_18115 [Chloroflexota bacterium]|nr:hypothetical protein [Chloroflexota bacterium]